MLNDFDIGPQHGQLLGIPGMTANYADPVVGRRDIDQQASRQVATRHDRQPYSLQRGEQRQHPAVAQSPRRMAIRPPFLAITA